MGWRAEFGSDWQVPSWIEESMLDVSWHNDELPSFTRREWSRDEEGCLPVHRLWVDRPESDDVQYAGYSFRFSLSYSADGDTSEDVFVTNDETEMRAILAALVRGITKNGAQITNPSMDETGRIAVDPFSYYGITKG